MPDGGRTLPGENQAFAEVLLGALAEAGIRHLCLCPGSRSTPLVVAAARTKALRLHAQLDERSAAFFALGLARASRQAVALLCTSGTAAANFLPAIVEAHHARVPLVVLTADRPPELRGWGAGQTIDQLRLFGSHVRLFVEAPTPCPGTPLAAYARALGRRAVSVAEASPAGPVHLNLPFREPLEPPAGHDTVSSAPVEVEAWSEALRAAPARLTPGIALVETLTDIFRTAASGVVVAGPMDREPALADAAARLSAMLGWPLLAEPISQLRTGPHVAATTVLAHADAFLREASVADAHAPDVVLRLGDTPTSKPLRRWLEARPSTRLYLVDPDDGWQDPTHRAAAVLRVDPALLCQALAGSLTGASPRPEALRFSAALASADRCASRTIESVLAAEPRLFAPAVVREVARALPDGATLFVSNSMPVRDVDAFWPADPRRVRVLCNRGANGIDGIISTALGASLASPGPTVLLTGDLAFLHDVGGLFAARRLEASCTIVALNDDGGGIFSYLPIAEHGESVRFQDLFTLPHGLRFEHAASLYGIGHERIVDRAGLRRALDRVVGAPGVRVLEIPLDRDANVAHHRALWRAVGAALREQEGPR